MDLRPAELKELGRRIRRHRQELGLSQEAVARAGGLSRADLGNLELGRYNASFAFLCGLAPALQTDLGSLLEHLPFSSTAIKASSDEAAGEEEVARDHGRRWKIDPEAIKAYRRRHGLTQKALGRLCGVNASSVTQWEAGTEPSGPSALLLGSLLAGGAAQPLTREEEGLLDELVRRGNFQNRADCLAATLLDWVQEGRLDDRGRVSF